MSSLHWTSHAQSLKSKYDRRTTAASFLAGGVVAINVDLVEGSSGAMKLVFPRESPQLATDWRDKKDKSQPVDTGKLLEQVWQRQFNYFKSAKDPHRSSLRLLHSVIDEVRSHLGDARWVTRVKAAGSTERTELVRAVLAPVNVTGEDGKVKSVAPLDEFLMWYVSFSLRSDHHRVGEGVISRVRARVCVYVCFCACTCLCGRDNVCARTCTHAGT